MLQDSYSRAVFPARRQTVATAGEGEKKGKKKKISLYENLVKQLVVEASFEKQ